VQHATRDIGCDSAAKAMSTEAAAAAAAKDAKALESVEYFHLVEF